MVVRSSSLEFAEFAVLQPVQILGEPPTRLLSIIFASIDGWGLWPLDALPDQAARIAQMCPHSTGRSAKGKAPKYQRLIRRTSIAAAGMSQDATIALLREQGAVRMGVKRLRPQVRLAGVAIQAVFKAARQIARVAFGTSLLGLPDHDVGPAERFALDRAPRFHRPTESY